MSLGDGGQASLRALAHPARLRILSLLTGASLTAAEVARALGLTHANASYHLRTLAAAGLIATAGEEKIRGGLARRYRYDPAVSGTRPPVAPTPRAAESPAGPGPGVTADAELWVDPETWREITERITAAVHDLHAAACPAGTPGTVRTSTTVAMFEMEAG
ncbi:ArsR/SmtB family transcription factor [Actinoplanes palleronii]|uniref:HTH arsR-type domain-containing protein n=1 Tax=Actinoplanes palleronii TaxID=113570 RepID=A0ABQ4B8I2_9ACTN|nr:metalloregulator ArsR/SmtB family transcription factor [Actinoplanes palleronii]GIE66731.1 hypothetical protein Apa02nite_028390 [Actinoplanes palleronii]